MSNETNEPKWEHMPGRMSRYPVPGGWLYDNAAIDGQATTTYVPDPHAPHVAAARRDLAHGAEDSIRAEVDRLLTQAITEAHDGFCASASDTLDEAMRLLGMDPRLVVEVTRG